MVKDCRCDAIYTDILNISNKLSLLLLSCHCILAELSVIEVIFNNDGTGKFGVALTVWENVLVLKFKILLCEMNNWTLMKKFHWMKCFVCLRKLPATVVTLLILNNECARNYCRCGICSYGINCRIICTIGALFNRKYFFKFVAIIPAQLHILLRCFRYFKFGRRRKR